MTPAQKDLARHALGLPNKNQRSYRRHFVTGEGCRDYPEWEAMVEAGQARKRHGSTLPYGGDHCYWLTRAGAVLALEPGESLDAEDFPELPA